MSNTFFITINFYNTKNEFCIDVISNHYVRIYLSNLLPCNDKFNVISDIHVLAQWYDVKSFFIIIHFYNAKKYALMFIISNHYVRKYHRNF